MTQKISEKQGRLLLKLAREIILDQFGGEQFGLAALKKACTDPILKENRGTFVTLHKKGNLRGCIGNIEPSKSLVDGVCDNAKHAAFNDSRFSPLLSKELDQTTIEISVLTQPEKVDYVSTQELLEKLRPKIDGVIIRKQYHSATFLPQVWDQLPDADDFLNHLCAKAGLASAEWKRGDVEVFVYQVQSFEESADSSV